MTTSWKIVLIVVGILITASGWIVALRKPAATPLAAEADREWHGTPEQGAALIEKKKRDDAFRQKYGVDPAFNPTKEQRAAWEKYQKNERDAERDAAERWRKDRAAGKPVLP